MQNLLVYCWFSTHSCIARFFMTSSILFLVLKLDVYVPSMILHQVKLENHCPKCCCHKKWSQVFEGVQYVLKKLFISLQMLRSFSPCGQMFQNLVQDPAASFSKEFFLYHLLLNVLKMVVRKCFWCENALGLQGLTDSNNKFSDGRFLVGPIIGYNFLYFLIFKIP